MGSSTIPVDLGNPGQVFACLGVAEAVQALVGGHVESAFRCEGRGNDVTFEIHSSVSDTPVFEVVTFLRSASVRALIPDGSIHSTKKWKVDEVVIAGRDFPSHIPGTPATLPVLLRSGERSITLSSWADGPHVGVDNVKFWAGSGGYPAAALTQDIIDLIQGLNEAEVQTATVAPFTCSAPMSSSFRFDWRRDYVPLEVGFSPNKHSDMTMVGYPFTELLAAIGLQYARPKRIHKLHYRYAVWTDMLPNVLARPVLGAVDIGSPMRTFKMILSWPGKEGQARCIIDAREET